MKDVSVEYAHIYTNKKIGAEQELSLEVLEKFRKESGDKTMSLVVMIDDYSFPDPSFDYGTFSAWLGENGNAPDLILRESQLIPACDAVLHLIKNEKIKGELGDYVRSKKYPCSLFIAAWYLIRLGHIKSPLFSEEFIGNGLLNILPLSFKPFEDKAFEIINSTEFSSAVSKIENRYFEGRSVSEN